METIFATRQTLLSILNEELNTNYEMAADAFRDWRERQSQEDRAEAVGVCGFPCVGDCSTCVESEAALTAFFAEPVAAAAEPAEPDPVVAAPIVSEASASVEGSGPSYAEEPVEGQQMAYAGDESQNSALENARAMDALEEAQRSGEAYDDAEEEYRGCNCLDCLNHDDPDYRPSYYDDQDDGYGLDWNESGYFD